MRALTGCLPASVRDRLIGEELAEVTELRFRLMQGVELRGAKRSRVIGPPLTRAEMAETLSLLTGHSFYALEERMREGFFTLPGGCRVGVTGRYGEGGALQEISSLSLRVAREMKGAADGLRPRLMREGRPLSSLLLSPPGLGKTTLLRDLIRGFSCAGFTVAVADEREELAGGAPRMDLGPRTDVMSGCAKAVALLRLIRSMSPEIVATDEIGGEEDARALGEAGRAGAAALATAHAGSYREAAGRPSLARMLKEGLFERVVVLGGAPGRVAEILNGGGERLWAP